MYNLPQQEWPQCLLLKHREETQGTDWSSHWWIYFCKTFEGSDWEKLSHISYHASFKSAENPNWEQAHSPLGTCKNKSLTSFLRTFPFHDGQVGLYMSLTSIHSLTKTSSLLLYTPQGKWTARAATCMVQSGSTCPILDIQTTSHLLNHLQKYHPGPLHRNKL